MHRNHLCGFALAMFTLISASVAQAQTVVAHETDLVFDGVNAQVDAYDTYSSPSAVTFSPTVPVYGDPTTFVWDGSGALAVSNVSASANTGTANLALTGTGSALNPLVGYSHYGYASTLGQGLFTAANVGGGIRLSLATPPTDLSGPNTPYTLNVAFLGNWSTNGTGPLQIDANSFAVTSNFIVTKNFIYDPTFDETFFSATAAGRGQQGAFVPEPGSFALLLGISMTSLGFMARQQRRA